MYKNNEIYRNATLPRIMIIWKIISHIDNLTWSAARLIAVCMAWSHGRAVARVLLIGVWPAPGAVAVRIASLWPWWPDSHNLGILANLL